MATRSDSVAYSRFWVPILARCHDAGLSGNEMVVLLALMQWQKMDRGTVTVSQPVSKLAEVCHMSESAVSSAIRQLLRHGALRRTARGHNGGQASYALAWSTDRSSLAD